MFDFPVYGLTETSPVSHHDRSPPKIGTVGHLVPNTLGKVGQHTPFYLLINMHSLSS